MNLSGNAVRFWMQKENIPLENVLVITDDLALPFGTLRLRKKSLTLVIMVLKNIQEVLQTPRLWQTAFRCISADFPEGKQVDYVLGKWERRRTKNVARQDSIICKSQFVLLFRWSLIIR